MLIILTSIDDEAKAKDLAQALVKKKLAACVQISAQGTSIYPWQGNICVETEHYISIKTDEAHQQAVITWLEANHPYDTPEIISLDAKASAQYEHWLQSALH